MTYCTARYFHDMRRIGVTEGVQIYPVGGEHMDCRRRYRVRIQIEGVEGWLLLETARGHVREFATIDAAFKVVHNDIGYASALVLEEAV